MGIETLQKAALAAGFAMATPDDDPPLAEHVDAADDISAGPASGWSLCRTRGAALCARQLASAFTWIRDHLPLMGAGAPRPDALRTAGFGEGADKTAPFCFAAIQPSTLS